MENNNVQFYNKLYKFLIMNEIMPENKADTWVHALLDINESFDEVYKNLLPKFMSEQKKKEEIKNLIREIHEQFRHIQYHLNDAQLTK